MNLAALRARIQALAAPLLQRFRALPRWGKTAVIVCAVILVGAVLVLARGGGSDAAGTSIPTVTLQRVGSFGGDANSVSALGTVRSVSEAELIAQSGGTVRTLNVRLGDRVAAGSILATLDSAAAAATLLQAQGAYDAAVAAKKAIDLQAGNSTMSLEEAQLAARTTYQSAYTTLSSVLANDVDVFFGANTPTGPQLLINPLTTGDTLQRERRSIDDLMDAWRASLPTVQTTDPLTLLSNAQTRVSTVQAFLVDLANLAHQQGSGATAAQLASLATAQSTVNGLVSSISTTRSSYNAAVTAAAVGKTQSGGPGVSSSEASVEIALGGLRAAQAAYEKTVIRTPIAGTVNYLPISVGAYVNAGSHVATVAQNNALEVVMELSQSNANRLAIGDTVQVGGTPGKVTAIAPALDPATKQIEVRVAVSSSSTLVDGQSVQVSLPAPTGVQPARQVAHATTTVGIQLPLTAVKLLPDERDVFTVDAGHIVAQQVTIGDVVGDRIIVTSPLSPDLEIVTDVRGLAAGDAVLVSSTTPAL